MNDVTSMLYVSLVKQLETLLFYVVTSRIEALVVSRHKFLNACIEKVYGLLLHNCLLSLPPVHLNGIAFQRENTSCAKTDVSRSVRGPDCTGGGGGGVA
jgi:TRAP-type mannitol/chloroaromatic compound transport system permease large subunit